MGWTAFAMDILAALVLGLLLLALVAWAVRRVAAAVRARRGIVAVVEINGPIGSGGLWSEGVPALPLLQQIEQVSKDRRIRALVLRISSPGGSAAATQEVAEEVQRAREAGKRVVASVGDMAASGGYWLACQAEQIVAPPAAILGSIGVIIAKANVKQFLERHGIQREKVLSGPHKDHMNADRPWTEEERALLQATNQVVFEQFVQVVATGRGRSLEEVRKIADGRIFTASEAIELGLCDEIGNLNSAVRRARQLAGLPESAPVRWLGRRRLFPALARALSRALAASVPD